MVTEKNDGVLFQVSEKIWNIYWWVYVFLYPVFIHTEYSLNKIMGFDFRKK